MFTDEECAEQASHGNDAAFAELFRRHQSAVFHLAVRLLESADDAEDVTQETFLRAFRYLHTFDRQRSFKSWLMGIAVRQCANVLQKRRQRRESSLDDLGEKSGEPASVEHQAPSRLEQTVRLVLDTLPIKQQLAFVLFADGGYTMGEIATMLNCSEGAVKTHLHRARIRLRREVQSLTISKASGGDYGAMPTCTKGTARSARCPERSATQISSSTRCELQGM